MKVYHNSFFAMGSRFNAVLPFEEEDLCERLFMKMKNEVQRIESKLSYFDTCSTVSKINSEAAVNSVGLDDELFEIIRICLEYNKKTYGAFDITMRPIIEKILDGTNGDSETEHLKSQVDDIELNEAQKEISFKSDNVKIDFGGFGKGYALEKIKKILQDSPLENAFISFGESSILTKGSHPNGNNWSVGIKDLFNPGKPAYTFELLGESVSSSSNYFTDDNGELRKKVNIIDPVTMRLTEGISQACVTSDSPMLAEILSTAFLVLPEEKIKSVLRSLPGTSAVKISYENQNKSINEYNRDT